MKHRAARYRAVAAAIVLHRNPEIFDRIEEHDRPNLRKELPEARLYARELDEWAGSTLDGPIWTELRLDDLSRTTPAGATRLAITALRRAARAAGYLAGSYDYDDQRVRNEMWAEASLVALLVELGVANAEGVVEASYADVMRLAEAP